ncbi:MAG: GspE/PulE family protein [Clostridium sp.]
MANVPIGLELIKKGIITDVEIRKALDYQKQHPEYKLVEILEILDLTDRRTLLEVTSDIFGFPGIDITMNDVNIDIKEFYSVDLIKQDKVLPFDIVGNKLKVAFADPQDSKLVKKVELLALSKGYNIEVYYTFGRNILKIIDGLEHSDNVNITENSDVTTLIDTIIKTGMKKRASDIHIEPLEKEVRIRYRIDGELITVSSISNKKQGNIIGRIKAISNMYQEKKTSQDGRIIIYPDYNIRVSSQKNVHGEKIVLRLLKKDKGIRDIFDLGFPRDEKILKKSFNKRNSITVIAAPTGEGKTTTLYSILDYLNRPEINITTIEDPVEIRVDGINQIEIDENTSFADSLRTVLRQDPDIILVGEIRDLETAEIAMQSGQTGHYVLSTIHTIDAIEVITRLRKMGISNYDIASTLATSVSQRLVRQICPHCAKKREFTKEEKEIMTQIAEKYGVTLDFKGKETFEKVGCKLCNYTGYLDRIACYEVLNIDEEIKQAIMEDKSTIEIKKIALNGNYKPLVIDGIQKILEQKTTLEELNNKLALY